MIHVWCATDGRWARDRVRIDSYASVSVESWMRILRMANAVAVGLGLRGRMVRFDVVLGKIGDGLSSWPR